jgi:hypothetical protein
MQPSKASALPLKDTTSTPVAAGGNPPYDGDMEHRLTALETRLDTILPTLATKADIGEIRADLHKMNIEIKSWTLTTVLTIVGTMLAAIFGISQISKAVVAPATSTIQPAPIVITIPAPTAPTPANSR